MFKNSFTVLFRKDGYLSLSFLLDIDTKGESQKPRIVKDEVLDFQDRK
ncbi:protein of unknown function [Candidatus Methylacidiphilum fumarolicum]|uniref:Uncharacterized protein n=1 Tax=Candidatus Methylacidiphilum fumarolicum TaxID=591154 RepID=A0ABM9IA55_9BACT|nr:protein of unknown function [Candidatus Methylacidiphilum fumarolicum]